MSCRPVPESCIWATGGLSPIFPSTARMLASIPSKLVLQGIHQIHLYHPSFIIYYLSFIHLSVIYVLSITHPSSIIHP